jgi:RimJ/RimL family protein N-acetyltransferase
MKRIVFNEPAVTQYVVEAAKATLDAGDVSIGVVDDDRLGHAGWVRGGVVYTQYTGASIMLHVAGRDEAWMTRDMLRVGFHYPFVQLGVKRLYGLLESANEPALNFDLRLGFRVAAVLPDMFASGAGLVVTMEREECRWLSMRPRTVVERGFVDGWQG